jgi:RNA polymerase sigma-70 factor, ECF subfamily
VIDGETDGDHRTDAELLQAHAEGDPDAFAELVARHQDRMWAIALRIMRNREDAADALQDAYISAFRCERRSRSPRILIDGGGLAPP